MSAQHTPGPWYWHTDDNGNVSLCTPNRGRLYVMDFARKGMSSAQPRFSRWEGVERGRQGGIMTPGVEHPDARLIAAAPDLAAVLRPLMQRVQNLVDGGCECDLSGGTHSCDMQRAANEVADARAALAKAGAS